MVSSGEGNTRARPVSCPVVGEVVVAACERLTRSFVRVHLAGSCLAAFGVDGPMLDQRFKLILPSRDGSLPEIVDRGAQWREAWLDLPAHERGHVRTYTVRDVVHAAEGRQIVVDIVVHGDAQSSGPGSRWAQQARPGDRLIVVGPRLGHQFGGVEFAPRGARRILLGADETAAPAVHGVLRDLPRDSRGVVFVEVPHTADVLNDLIGPPGVVVRWLPRDGSPRGQKLCAAVTAHLGTPAEQVDRTSDDEVDDALWETPTFSSSGDDRALADVTPVDHRDFYLWIAGESAVVARLRRHLIAQAGLPRRQAAFMGYWRHGAGTRS